jgi:dipeptidase
VSKAAVSAILLTGLCILPVLSSLQAHACTSILVTRGASVDGSTMITYAADAHVLYGELYYWPGGIHASGTMIDVYEWDTGDYMGKIPQAPVTYNVVGNMNEHQLAITETTFGGRAGLVNRDGIIDYGSLKYLALQRARTAREAIEVMTGLVTEYGYVSKGESFSIADADEVWIMEMIGKGPEHHGAVWVARLVPDGYVTAHANQSRIRTFPLEDRKNTLYSPDVITFAREMGFYEGKDEDFSFTGVYGRDDWGGLRYCEARVWQAFRRMAPSLNLSDDLVKGVPDAEPLPLWIKPDRKLSVQDVQDLMRDHFQGTDLDLSQGIGAGPYNKPYRWRPLSWELDGKKHFHERSTSTQQTGFSLVSQSRNWLPDPIGGILWFGVDDTYSTVYVPMYCGITSAPYNFAVGTGNFDEFSWDSAFWVFNWVANQAYARYKDIIQDIQIVQRELESRFAAQAPEVDAAALALYKQSPRLAHEYLTEFSHREAARTHARWRKLGEEILVKYLDGNVRDEHGVPRHPPYPEQWLRRIVEERPGFYEIPEHFLKQDD